MDAHGLTITDTVTGDHPAVARFILHPDAHVERAGDAEWTATLSGGHVIGLRIESGSGRLEPAHYAPEFGKVLATHCLAVHLSGGQGVTRIAWN